MTKTVVQPNMFVTRENTKHGLCKWVGSFNKSFKKTIGLNQSDESFMDWPHCSESAATLKKIHIYSRGLFTDLSCLCFGWGRYAIKRALERELNNWRGILFPMLCESYAKEKKLQRHLENSAEYCLCWLLLYTCLGKLKLAVKCRNRNDPN